MLTELQSAAIQLLIIIVLIGGAWVWGDVHGRNAAAVKYQAQLASAQIIENNANAKITAQTKTISLISDQATDNQAEADRENKYAITLENEIKAHPLPVDCKPTAARLRWLSGAGKN